MQLPTCCAKLQYPLKTAFKLFVRFSLLNGNVKWTCKEIENFTTPNLFLENRNSVSTKGVL